MREYWMVWLTVGGPLIVVYLVGVWLGDFIAGWAGAMAFALAYLVAMLLLLRHELRRP